MNNKIMKIITRENETDFSKTVKELTYLEFKSTRIRSNLCQKIFELLQKIHETFLKIIPRIDNISNSLNTVEKSQKQSEEKIGKLDSLIKVFANDLTEFSAKTEVTARNMQQIRSLTERVSERVDSISQEFIDRHVIEPIFKDFGSFYNTLRTMKQPDKVLLDQFQLLLESHEIQIIEPEKGDAFNPLEHQPLQKIETQNPIQDKTVSSTLRIGFKHKDRIIQRAQVAVNIYNN